MEDEIYDHVSHKHGLSRIPESARKGETSHVCYGCWRAFLPGEATYGCSLRCGFEWFLHKECMEMPREITHPIHPSHPLTLALNHSKFKKCAVCKSTEVGGLGYKCRQACDGFWIHMECCEGFEDKDEKQAPLAHPSHPQHELRFSKKTRWCPFPCDACGATEKKGDSYICTLCDYWIHHSCALLPHSAHFPHHHHSLSLAFSTPRHYILNRFDCGVCNTTLPLSRWVYHCRLCSYVVHLNCATSTFVDGENEDAKVIDDERVATKFPIAVDEMYEEMIIAFVKRQRGQILIPRDHGKYSFSHHPHPLTFNAFSSCSSSSSQDHYKKDDEEYDEDDFDRWELTCDGCTLPIRAKKPTDDDDDDYENENGYMSCDECKYFLHLSCFNLPLEIPSLPIHPLKDHNLRLHHVDGKLTGWIRCDICRGYTNGLYYACTYKGCVFKIDIKCASLPNTIKHAAHPRHNYLKLVTENEFRSGFCVNCYWPISERKEQYKCNCCRFCVCAKCVMLPATNKHRLENHVLALTYDAYVNRPGEFYCSNCEGQMQPRDYMYHCRDCDQSFHPRCFPATSGDYRNINFGREQYVISKIHDSRHSLRFQIITNKKRCDLCHVNYYDKPGFQCVSCFFVVCLTCGLKHMG
ncbi:uncharacterized protein LOC121754288 [Salvia splendens]|uniref:uncharacterized protein LOC121754288 n=1 Tax=Salvia splendens TaxID=180675 RepID=UPI001C25BCAE|nr:uncharacterized protein LOC121754288 [Salvia splendens]